MKQDNNSIPTKQGLFVRAVAGVLVCALVLWGCSGKAKLGAKCSFDDQCAPEKGVVCVGAEGLGYGACGCHHGSSWHSLFGKCVDDSLLEIKVHHGSKEGAEPGHVQAEGAHGHAADAFASECEGAGDCDSSLGLECVARKCLCHPPGDSTVSWFWSKKYPDRDCRVTTGKRYFGAKMVCEKPRSKPGEYYIPARVWWNQEKARCLSLKERRSLSVKTGIRFVDWGEAMRDFQ